MFRERGSRFGRLGCRLWCQPRRQNRGLVRTMSRHHVKVCESYERALHSVLREDEPFLELMSFQLSFLNACRQCFLTELPQINERGSRISDYRIYDKPSCYLALCDQREFQMKRDVPRGSVARHKTKLTHNGLRACWRSMASTRLDYGYRPFPKIEVQEELHSDPFHQPIIQGMP